MAKLKSDPGLVERGQEALRGHLASLECLSRRGASLPGGVTNAQWENICPADLRAMTDTQLQTVRSLGEQASKVMCAYADWLVTTQNPGAVPAEDGFAPGADRAAPATADTSAGSVAPAAAGVPQELTRVCSTTDDQHGGLLFAGIDRGAPHYMQFVLSP